MISLQGKSRAYRIACLGVLTALALVVSVLESVIPVFAVIPLPGVKLGFANIIIVFSLFYLGNAEGISVAVIRCLLSALLFGSFTTLLFSLCGTALSVSCAVVYKYIKNKYISLIGLSVICAAAHNIGQIIASCITLHSSAPFSYLPLLLVASVVTGGITGLILQLSNGYFKFL